MTASTERRPVVFALLGVLFSGVAAGIGGSISVVVPSPATFFAIIGLTLVAVGSSLLMVREPNRFVLDPSTPIMMATGFVAGPLAPIVLVIQAKLIAWAAVRRQGWRLCALNDGILSTRWLVVGALISAAPTVDVVAKNLVLVLMGAAAVTAIGVLVNYPLAAISVRLLYDRWPGGADYWKAQVRDIGVSAGAVAFAWAVPATTSWALLPAIAAAALYTEAIRSWFREHGAALQLEAQARIISAERDGRNPGHTERMVEIVRQHSIHLPEKDRSRLEAASWLHSLTFGGTEFRCSGVNHNDELVRMVATLPRQRGIADSPLLRESGYMGRASTPEAQLIAAACAWDSRHLPTGPIREPADLVHIFGIDPRVASTVTETDM